VRAVLVARLGQLERREVLAGQTEAQELVLGLAALEVLEFLDEILGDVNGNAAVVCCAIK
jgi:hypothetical protein